MKDIIVFKMLEVLLGLLLVCVSWLVVAVYHRWIIITIPPDSGIYQLILYVKRYRRDVFNTSIHDKTILITMNGGMLAYPYDDRWKYVKISLLFDNGELLLSLPSGAVFTYTANQLGVHEVIINDSYAGSRHVFTDDQIPTLTDNVEEL